MSIVRAALIAGGKVANVIVLDTEADWAPPAGHTALNLPAGSPVGPGWRYDGSSYHEPPTFTADRSSIPGDGTTAAVVTYADTYDPPGSVTFTVNGATQAVTTAAGVATLEVTSSTAGDTVVVSVDALPGVTLTINVEG